MADREAGIPLVNVQSGNDQNSGCLQVIQPGFPNSSSLIIDPGADLHDLASLNSPAHHINRNQAWPKLIRSGLVPLIPGLWSHSLPGFTGKGSDVLRMMRYSGNFTGAQLQKAKTEMQAHNRLEEDHAVLVTHGQHDSVNLMAYLQPDLQIYTTAATGHILAAWERESNAPDHEFVTVVHRDEAKVKGRFKRSPRNINLVEPGNPLPIAGFSEVKLTETSHFLGSAAINVTFANGVRLVATGDLGAGAETEAFIAGLEGSKPEMLVLDAMHIGDNTMNLLHQPDLACVFDRILQKNVERQQGNWLAGIPVRHLERLGAMIEIAQRTKRQLFLPLEMAFYLEQMQDLRDKHPEISALSDVGIFLEPSGSRTYRAKDYPPALRAVAFTPEGNLRSNVLTAPDLAKQFASDRLVVVVNNVKNITNLAAAGAIDQRAPGGPIQGQSNRTFSTHMITANYYASREERRAWQQAAQIAGITPEHSFNLHVSDHLTREALISLVARIQPGVIIPLHTREPRAAAAAFAGVAPNAQIIQSVSRGRINGYYGGKRPFRKAKV